MNISALHSAKGQKFKLRSVNGKYSFTKDSIVIINVSAGSVNDFFVKTNNGDAELFTAEKKLAKYIIDLLELEKNNQQKNIFVIEDYYDEFIEIQSYAFANISEYKTSITIQVPESVLEKNAPQKLYDMFVYEDIGQPAIFALRYKDNKKTDIRLISGNRFLQIKNTPRGLIVADNPDSRKDRTHLPIVIFLAPKIEFVPESSGINIDGTIASDLDKISNAETYFSRWEAYNDLAKKEIEARSGEFGEIKYNNYKRNTIEGGSKFTFYINDTIEKSYLGESVEVKDAINDRAYNLRNVRVGEISKIFDDKLETVLKREDIVISLPDSGVLVLSTFGDREIVKRREKAKDRMIKNMSPIRYIVPLIEEGASEYASDSNWENNKAITDELRKNFKQAKQLNDQQKKALELAINTPDIALIQGPPGTGKTTVIKAICERFREIFERDNNEERPKILISSFQNDAVDNAVSNPLPGELPAYRIGKKQEEHFKESVGKWADEVKNELVKSVGNKDQLEFSKINSRLCDKYFVYKKTGEKPEDGIRLIKEYLSIPGIQYPPSIKKEAETLISVPLKTVYYDTQDDPFIICLREQRLTKESFNDDGEKKVKKLRAYIRIQDDLDIEITHLEAINNVADNGINDEKIFKEYIEAINALRKKYLSDKDQNNNVGTNQIDALIQKLVLAFYDRRLSTTDDLEEKKAIIIGEFLDKFENEAESLIGKYSLTTAATCQQSMPSSNRAEDSYDMVIVDEAARANPLDLFIPMSMGRKIILVGDHKQLPHMLEPDVLKLIMDDPKYKNLPDMDISLFERLFSMFEKGLRPKSILLNEQYRMHPDICQFVSEAFYENKLKSGITAEDRYIPHNIFGGKALAYINVTKNQGLEESGISKSRLSEARLIAENIKKLTEICPDKKLGVITFYSAQESILKDEINKVLNNNQLSNVEIGTVDAFQGKEFDHVFLSCVRSNTFTEEKDRIGFLVKPNRICVALSRAKYQLAVYADAETINAVECFKLLYEKCKIKNEGYYCEY